MQRRSSHPVGHHDELLGFTDASGLQLAEDNCAHVLEGRKEAHTQEEGSLASCILSYFMHPVL